MARLSHKFQPQDLDDVVRAAQEVEQQSTEPWEQLLARAVVRLARELHSYICDCEDEEDL